MAMYLIFTDPKEIGERLALQAVDATRVFNRNELCKAYEIESWAVETIIAEGGEMGLLYHPGMKQRHLVEIDRDAAEEV